MLDPTFLNKPLLILKIRSHPADPAWGFHRIIPVSPFSMWPDDHANGGLV